MLELVHIRADDLDHLEAYANDRTGPGDPWDVEFRQMEAGRFEGHVIGMKVTHEANRPDGGKASTAAPWPGQLPGTVFMSRNHVQPKLNIIGAAPSTHIAFILPIGPNSSLRINGLDVGPDQILSLAPGEDISMVTGEDFEFISLRIRRDVTDQMLWAVSGARTGNRHCVVTPDSVELKTIESTLCQALTPNGFPHRSANGALAFDAHVLDLLAIALGNARPRTLPTTRTVSDRIARQAREYLEAYENEPIQIDALCEAMGAAPRTVFHAFSQYYGSPPIRYHRNLRLKRARDALKQAVPAAQTVTEIAMDWGFWHLGRFAGDYKALFQESPAQTLASRHTAK